MLACEKMTKILPLTGTQQKVNSILTSSSSPKGFNSNSFTNFFISLNIYQFIHIYIIQMVIVHESFHQTFPILG